MVRFCSCLWILALSCAVASAQSQNRKVITVGADPSSGRLVRRVIQPRLIAPVVVKTAETPAPNNTPGLQLGPDASVNEIVEAAAKKHNVDPLLVHSVIQVESAYNPYAVSRAGAQGLMQLIPSTARQLGVRNPFDPKENIEAGVRYLKQLQETFRDDRLALAAYNAGQGAVNRYGNQIPPYAETQNYVYQVGKRWGAARRASEQQRPAQAVTQPEAPKIESFTDAEGRLVLRMQ